LTTALGFVGALVFAIAATAIVMLLVLRGRPQSTAPAHDDAPPAPAPAPMTVPVTLGEVQLVRRNPFTVEGMEIRYAADALVRSVRVGAMNSEHKELLLTMNETQWRSMPNAHKQEVLAAARSSWAAKMCADGPDIAYVIIKTESGEVVGRADPHSVTVV